MEDKQENEKVDDSSDTSNSFIKPIISSNIRQIKRLRLALLILNVICFGYFVADGIIDLYNSSDQSYPMINVTIFIHLIFMALYGLGVYATYKYDIDGLYTFVGFGIILLYFTGAVLVHLIFSSLTFSNGRSSTIRVFVFFDLMVIIVHIAVKLTYLLDPVWTPNC